MEQERLAKVQRARAKRRALITQMTQLQGVCDNCGESDIRILTFVDPDNEYRSLGRLANIPVSHRKLVHAIGDASLLCQNCIAKGLLDILDGLKVERRRAKEQEAAMYEDMENEVGVPSHKHRLATALRDSEVSK